MREDDAEDEEDEEDEKDQEDEEDEGEDEDDEDEEACEHEVRLEVANGAAPEKGALEQPDLAVLSDSCALVVSMKGTGHCSCVILAMSCSVLLALKETCHS